MQSHQRHQLICHGWSENVRANECMSSEGGKRAFGEGRFCAGRRPWLRVCSGDILGWANAGRSQVHSIPEWVGTIARWGSWGWVCFWRPTLGCRPETMGKKKKRWFAKNYFNGCVACNFIDFSKLEVTGSHGFKGRPKCVHVAFVLNLAAWREFWSQALKPFQGGSIWEHKDNILGIEYFWGYLRMKGNT